MTMRLVGRAVRQMQPAAARHDKLVAFSRELLGTGRGGHGLPHGLIAYLVDQNLSLFAILPEPVQSATFKWIMSCWARDVLGATEEEAVAAILEARPDVADLVATPKGRAWLQRAISGKDLGL